MKIRNISALVLSSILTITPVLAAQVHTWHNVSSQDGNWNATLAPINEKSSFVAADGSTPLKNFTIDPAHSVKFGFSFDPEDDFDVAYTLTLTQKNTTAFTSKTCVFVVTAKGPANPDIRALNYNGANCSSFVVHGVGEDFIVS